MRTETNYKQADPAGAVCVHAAVFLRGKEGGEGCFSPKGACWQELVPDEYC